MTEPLINDLPTPLTTMDDKTTPYCDNLSEKTSLPLPIDTVSTPKKRSLKLVIWRLLVAAAAIYLFSSIVFDPPPKAERLEQEAELIVTETEAGLEECRKAPLNFGGDKSLAQRLGYKLVLDVPKDKVPGGKGVKKGGEKPGRVIVVGDVHGMFHELVTLLGKLKYNQDDDYLILAGDIISKGPDSLKVLDLARDYGAGCVRGNHEDRILLHYHQIHKKKKHHKSKSGKGNGKKDQEKVAGMLRKYNANQEDEMEMDDPPELVFKETALKPDVDADEEVLEELEEEESNEFETTQTRTDKKLARRISRKQAAWLDACPLVLRMKKAGNIGKVEIVHAGLVHGVSLQDQDPNAIMNMRTLDKRCHLPTGEKSGIHWADLWNKAEKKRKGAHTTVVYGHYAAMGLDIRPYTKGLDSNCVRGGRLSAFVISSKHEEVVSVKCRAFLKE